MDKNFNKIKQLITSNINKFSDKQKKIANYIIENPQKFALKSIQELETELNISKSTIVRLAQTLGYSGLLDMKRDVKKYISNKLEPLEKYETILSTKETSSNFLNILTDEVIINIKKTQELIDNKQFNNFIKYIEESTEVHTLGAGISMYLSEITSYLLNRVSIRSFPFTRGGAPFPEQIINFRKNGLLLVFYFPSYDKEVKKTVIYAKERGLKVVAITDKATNEIVELADEYLQVAVDSCTVSNSVSTIITVIYAIIGQIGQDKKIEILENLKEVKHIRSE